MIHRLACTMPVLAALGLALAVTGCAEPKVKITGKVLKNGEPAKIANDTQFTLVFAPDDTEKGQRSPPVYYDRETSTYKTEFPPGKYRVSYVIVPKGEAPISAPLEVATKVHDLTKSQEFNIDIGSK